MKRRRMNWGVFAAALTALLSLLCALAGMAAMPRAPWPVTAPSILLFTVATLVWCYLRDPQDGDHQ